MKSDNTAKSVLVIGLEHRSCDLM